MTLPFGLIISFGIVFASLAGLCLVRRWLKTPHLRNQHDIADPYSQFVAMLFAVLLGFMVADSMQRFGDARKTVQEEASALGDVYRLSEGLPAEDCRRLRLLCISYATEVVNDEWPKMAQRQDSAKVWNIYRNLWSAVTTYEPVTQRQSNAQQGLLSAMHSIGDNRRLRVEALHSGLPLELWVVLSLGGFSTILFTYFFGAENFRIQLVMVGMVSLVVCLNLFLLATYDDPFSGDVRVTPGAFEKQLMLYESENQK